MAVTIGDGGVGDDGDDDDYGDYGDDVDDGDGGDGGDDDDDDGNCDLYGLLELCGMRTSGVCKWEALNIGIKFLPGLTFPHIDRWIKLEQ